MIDWNEEEKVDISTLSSYAEEALKLQESVDELENELKVVKKELEFFLTTKIPSAMEEVGVKSFTLSNGKKITIKDVIAGTIEKSPDREFAYNWVIDNEGADLIKTNVSIEFGKTEHNLASAFVDDCRNNYDIVPTVKETIHPQTFCAFVREKKAMRDEMLDNGEYVEDIPYKDLGLFVGKKAVFK